MNKLFNLRVPSSSNTPKNWEHHSRSALENAYFQSHRNTFRRVDQSSRELSQCLNQLLTEKLRWLCKYGANGTKWIADSGLWCVASLFLLTQHKPKENERHQKNINSALGCGIEGGQKGELMENHLTFPDSLNGDNVEIHYQVQCCKSFLVLSHWWLPKFFLTFEQLYWINFIDKYFYGLQERKSNRYHDH